MYDSYENLSGDVPIINVDDILCETIKKLDLYSHEIHFKGKVAGTEHIYGILPLPPRGLNDLRRNKFTNAVFVTMFFPKVVSDTGFKKAFLEFGEVHDLFDGKFKKPCNDISNGKGQSKYDLPHKILFDDS